ncbi:hypothetical protein C0J52_07876 [Blattella germanica]|nr:hypothetical protein C0J52_07876 [Blattella germanica]
MNFCDFIYLILHVVYGILVTTVYILGEILYIVIPRKIKSVKGEIILVTGAGRGLGRRIALNFGRRQAFVVCWDKNAENNQNTVWDIRQEGGQAIGFKCDVTDREAVMQTALLVQQQVGHVTILVNNAGIYPVKSTLDWTPEELRTLFDTNIFAHFWTLKAFLPAMIERKKGHIVAMSSAAAIAPVAHEVPYSATKSAVTGLMDGLIQEFRLQNMNNIKVTCVHPYYAASRNDLPVKFDLRIGRLSPDYVASEVVKGILQEREAISVPRFMLFWICFLRCLPQGARKHWREIFYTRVWPEPVMVQTEGKSEQNISPRSIERARHRSLKVQKNNRPALTVPEEVKVHGITDVNPSGDDNTNPVAMYNMINQESDKTSPSLDIITNVFTSIPQNNKDTEPENQEISKL